MGRGVLIYLQMFYFLTGALIKDIALKESRLSFKTVPQREALLLCKVVSLIKMALMDLLLLLCCFFTSTVNM